MIICVCNAIREKELRHEAKKRSGAPREIYARLGRRPKCGQCLSFARAIIDSEGETV